MHVRPLLSRALFGAALLAPAAAAQVTTPEAHLGREVGQDFYLPDWETVSSYFTRLAAESPRVLTSKVGETTGGRDFLLSVISSEANLARLDAIREQCRLVADPRGASDEALGEAVDEGVVVLFVSCAMHATECAAPQFAMQLAYELATGEDEFWSSIRERVVLLLAPSMNPDGLDLVARWYMDHVGGPYEASSLLELYQRYAGHDNNRDWFLLSQAETRIVSELLYRVWHPQVFWDVHQQGTRRERLFVPPFRDPLNPNLDPAVVAGIDQLGTRALFDLTRAGYTGVSTGVTYDMWWNGGNRNVPVRHNILGLLTEAASAKLATPVFLPKDELQGPGELEAYAPSNRFPAPWPGGWWRIGDVVDYELAFARSLLASLAREPSLWLANALEAAERAIETGRENGPRAWILPSDARDPAAVRRLVDALFRTGVEMEVAASDLEADGRVWPAGSIVIRRDQPYGAHVKDLFEVQRYPEGPPPYDVSGWTLPLLLGVHRVECMRMPEGELREVASVDEALADFAGDPRVAGADDRVSLQESSSWPRVFGWLAEGRAVELGTHADLDPSEAGLASASAQSFVDPVRIEELPRVGLYSPWSGASDEGWLRWLFESFGLPYVTVRNETLRAGELGRLLDVLVIPSLSRRELDVGREPGTVPDEFTGGLAPEGAVAVEEFVREGGTLIALGDAAAWAIELFELPLVDAARDESAKGFSCPGSVLRAIPEAAPITAGLPSSLAVFFADSSAWREMTDDEREASQRGAAHLEVLLRYAPSRLLYSGWIAHSEAIGGRPAWIRADHGRGAVHLFGFRPHYRGWSQAAFPLLFRAILFAGRAR